MTEIQSVRCVPSASDFTASPLRSRLRLELDAPASGYGSSWATCRAFPSTALGSSAWRSCRTQTQVPQVHVLFQACRGRGGIATCC
jgi:hypothetical protein